MHLAILISFAISFVTASPAPLPFLLKNVVVIKSIPDFKQFIVFHINKAKLISKQMVLHADYAKEKVEILSELSFFMTSLIEDISSIEAHDIVDAFILPEHAEDFLSYTSNLVEGSRVFWLNLLEIGSAAPQEHESDVTFGTLITQWTALKQEVYAAHATTIPIDLFPPFAEFLLDIRTMLRHAYRLYWTINRVYPYSTPELHAFLTKNLGALVNRLLYISNLDGMIQEIKNGDFTAKKAFALLSSSYKKLKDNCDLHSRQLYYLIKGGEDTIEHAEAVFKLHDDSWAIIEDVMKASLVFKVLTSQSEESDIFGKRVSM